MGSFIFRLYCFISSIYGYVLAEYVTLLSDCLLTYSLVAKSSLFASLTVTSKAMMLSVQALFLCNKNMFIKLKTAYLVNSTSLHMRVHLTRIVFRYRGRLELDLEFVEDHFDIPFHSTSSYSSRRNYHESTAFSCFDEYHP